MTSVCQIILVCEGWRDSRFIRSFLEAANVDPRKLHVRVNSRGSGHDWVKKELVEAVAELQRFKEGRGVIGILDEDGCGITTRREEVAQRLAQRNLPPLDCTKSRCLLLPSRNLETWLCWLEGIRTGRGWQVDEVNNFKTHPPPDVSKQDLNEFCRSAGTYLHALDYRSLPKNCPSMLALALQELREFLRAL